MSLLILACVKLVRYHFLLRIINAAEDDENTKYFILINVNLRQY